jgi:bifunctional aspartokinase / homoserine dehydrogenase 1
MRKPLRVMKFGGTSVGDACCIGKVAEIIRAAAFESDLVVVVSAMGGVTNKLIEAAVHAEAGNGAPAATILEQLRKQHSDAAQMLIHSKAERDRIVRAMEELFREGDRLCHDILRRRELIPEVRDSISSLGERLSAPLVAAALAEAGVACQPVEATEVVLTDRCHGAANPQMDRTRERCAARLRPLLEQGTIPVVTGFIGATEDGRLTTLGRGGSDYSATILGAVLEANEVIIWTDVDGMLTADPRLVPDACTIPEISYREAAELAYFGAKVLHPKTLDPVMQCGIPVWIRNTFAPERPGTKITPEGHPIDGGVRALTAIDDAAMITVNGPGMGKVPDVMRRTLAAIAAVRTDLLMISPSSGRNGVRLVVASALAQRTMEALRREFATDLRHEPTEHVSVDSSIAILTVVGQDLQEVRGIVGRALGELNRENVSVIATAQGSSDCNISFVVSRKDVRVALATTHREFQQRTLSLPDDSRSEAQLL